MKKNKIYLLLIPAFIFLMIFMVIPLFNILTSSFQQEGQYTLQGYINFFQDSYYVGIYLRTLRVAVVTTILAVIMGFPTAYFISLLGKKYRGIFIIFAVFPLLTSPVVRSFAWMIILGRNGIVNRTLLFFNIIESPLRLLYTEISITLGLLYLFLPLMIVSLVGVMQNIDKELMLAAQVLGASRFKAFLKVIFPLSLPGLVVGSALVFTGSLTAYTTPALLGGDGSRVLSTLIYRYAMTFFDWETASVIAIIMIATTFTVVGLISYFSKRMNPDKGGKRT